MFEKALSLLLIFSLAFNLAFVGIWIYKHPEPPPPPEALAPEPGPMPEPDQQPGSPDEGRPGRTQSRSRWRAPSGLHLTAEQQKAVGDALEQFGTKMRELNDSVRSHREALFRLLAEDDLDRAAVEAEQAQLEEAQQEMGRLVLAHILDMRGKLNPEQRREWLRMMAGHGDRMQTRFGFAPPTSTSRRPPFGGPRMPGRGMRQSRRGGGTFRPQGPAAVPREEAPQ